MQRASVDPVESSILENITRDDQTPLVRQDDDHCCFDDDTDEFTPEEDDEEYEVLVPKSSDVAPEGTQTGGSIAAETGGSIAAETGGSIAA